MEVLLVIVIVIGFFSIIGNQYALLRRVEDLQNTLYEINRKMKNDQLDGGKDEI